MDLDTAIRDVVRDRGVRLAERERIIAYRIVKEALTNVRRHAQAARVCVTMTETDGDAEIAVVDDGVGMAATETRDPVSP